jgi:hypothetical protein
MTIADVIRGLVAEALVHGDTPIVINTGRCADFADAVWRRFPEAKIFSDEDFGRDEYTHTFLKYKERYYDAETPDGVDDWQDLPIFHRQAEEFGIPFEDWRELVLLWEIP